MKYTIDATNKKLGRIASEAANLLMGKENPNFERNQLSGNVVEITNASKADIDVKKRKEKEYKRYSGYPGGLKIETMDKVIEKKGFDEIFKKAVYGMLPSNRLRDKIMKNLIITE